MRHIVVMSFAASIGLISVFLVDFVDLYFISFLGEEALAAAVGFAGTLLFFGVSITIGLMIAMSALAAQRLGAGKPEDARKIATNVIAMGVAVAAFTAPCSGFSRRNFLACSAQKVRRSIMLSAIYGSLFLPCRLRRLA